MRTELGDGCNEWDETLSNPDPDFDPFVERAKVDQKAAIKLSLDYYEEYPPDQPKFEIGQYVADNGFNVPLISTLAEWQEACDDETAMLRSEMPQDYSGLSGLLSSERLSRSPLFYEPDSFHKELGALVMTGLRNGTLNATEYMTNLRGQYSTWEQEKIRHMETATYFGAFNLLKIHQESASHWRYIEGTNISVFADPNVEGRYYFGVTPYDFPYTEGCRLDEGEYDTPQHLRLHKSPFIARPFIEYYEQIRNLPRFDNTQCPVLELQQGINGKMYFLQYIKTGQRQQYIEPFDLPRSTDIFRTNDVRGITTPSGVEMKLYLAPKHLVSGMERHAIYCEGRGLRVQLASKIARFILTEDYLSFKANHSDASPLYRPPLAASLCTDQNPESLKERIEQTIDRASRSQSIQSGVSYVNIRVTSNGREAAIESDWEIHHF